MNYLRSLCVLVRTSGIRVIALFPHPHLCTHLRGHRAGLPVASAVLMTGSEGEALKVFTEGQVKANLSS